MTPAVLYTAIGILAVIAFPFVLAVGRWAAGRFRSINEQRASLRSLQQDEALRRAARQLTQLEAARNAAERSAPAKLAALKQQVRS